MARCACCTTRTADDRCTVSCPSRICSPVVGVFTKTNEKKSLFTRALGITSVVDAIMCKKTNTTSLETTEYDQQKISSYHRFLEDQWHGCLMGKYRSNHLEQFAPPCPPALPAKCDDGLPAEQSAVRGIPRALREPLHPGGSLPERVLQ